MQITSVCRSHFLFQNGRGISNETIEEKDAWGNQLGAVPVYAVCLWI